MRNIGQKHFKVLGRQSLRQFSWVSDKERHLLVGVTVPVVSILSNDRLPYFLLCMLVSVK